MYSDILFSSPNDIVITFTRSHYSTLGPFAQKEAPETPEYPYTDIMKAYQGAMEDVEDAQDSDDEILWREEKQDKSNGFEGRGGGQNVDDTYLSKTLFSNHTSTAQRTQSQYPHISNMTGSKAFQRLLKNVFGDYFRDDADEEISADMSTRWVAFAKTHDPNYDESKANWLPWRYLPTQYEGIPGDDEQTSIPWEPSDFDYMDDNLVEEEEEDFEASGGYQWSEDRAERIYRRRALKALGMEVVAEDQHRTELRRITSQSGLNEMEAVFTFLFGNAESNSKRRRQKKGSNEKMSKHAIRQVQQIAQAMGVVGTGLRSEPRRSSDTARLDEDFFPELLDLRWPPEGRLIERDCTCDMWDRLRCKFFFFFLSSKSTVISWLLIIFNFFSHIFIIYLSLLPCAAYCYFRPILVWLILRHALYVFLDTPDILTKKCITSFS